MGRFHSLFFLACAACCGCQTTNDAPGASRVSQSLIAGAPEHQLLIVQLSPSGLSLVAARRVAMPLPALRTPRQTDWRATLRGPAGELLWEDFIAVGNRLRAELRNEDHLEGHHLVLPAAAFPIRTPASPGTVTLTVRRRSLSPEDPRGAGPGDEWVAVGTVTVTE